MIENDLVIYVQLHVRPECVEEWKRAFRAIADAMSREEAFVSCDLHQDAGDPTLFTLYERWADPASRRSYRTR